MKRKISKKRGGKRFLKKKKVKGSYRLFPVMFCLREKLVIGLSKLPMKFKASKYGKITPKYKVNFKHWRPSVCQFRSKEYIVDLSQYDENSSKIRCSKCNGYIDFRLFPSAKIPQLVEVYEKTDS